MPSALARKSIVTNQSYENSGGQQLRSQQSITSVLPHPQRRMESSLNWGPNNLEDLSFLRLPEVKAVTGLSKYAYFNQELMYVLDGLLWTLLDCSKPL